MGVERKAGHLSAGHQHHFFDVAAGVVSSLGSLRLNPTDR